MMAYTQQPPYDHGEGSPVVTGETDPLPPPFPPPPVPGGLVGVVGRVPVKL